MDNNNNNIDYTQFALTNDDIISEAIHRCKVELYKRAQPSADYNEIYQNYKKQHDEGKKIEAVYDRYYISQEEYQYVKDKYIKAYHLEDSFKLHCDIIIRDLIEGCPKDKYFPEKIDEDGFKHPGYRGYEQVPPIQYSIGIENANEVVDFIKQRKDFYRFNHLEERFNFAISLGDSPTQNPDTVIQYWKTQGVNIDIKPRHHSQDYFWCEENNYDYSDDELNIP